jgi:hypothetical protein
LTIFRLGVRRISARYGGRVLLTRRKEFSCLDLAQS